ncbi:VOC family protein [Paraburkholderia fungorum]|jgi:catechol 2,3-dioxygenase-like lactoylglutathione lyase family enzyme|uniref:VOC family protein n=1 Tax=Paraburkholderia fungorum TaxID=134537 RepID=A0AAP5QD29_9BURK|nr:VOC family protein [Paraburkholderia fungorum]MDT8839987.1 VOC family protein [Paraburkholderia fungorum]PRZ55120.1 glyoxalase-like protein [Paraburkholderia fungorum]
MSLSLDHIVIRVHDLTRTIEDFTALGFTVQQGGTHADGVTHNALIGFADGSYIELIAFLQAAPQRRWWNVGQRHGDGFVDYALLPSSVGAVIDAAHGRGLQYEGPQAGGRVRPDGARLEWQTGRPQTSDLPFLCGDITPRALRVAEGAVREHANGVRGVASLTVAVEDLKLSVQRYEALLGSEAVGARQVALPGLGAVSATVSIGDTSVVLLSPVHADAASVTAEGAALRRQLATRGEGVFGAALRGDGNAKARVLDRDHTHGAWFEIVAG